MSILTSPWRVFYADGSERLRWHLGAMEALKRRGHRRLAAFVARRIQSRFAVYISPAARIARSVTFPHPTGIVVGEGVVIGERVKIYQNVTLGGARVGDQQAGNYPEIGAGAVLFAGVVIVGKVRIGANATVGANSVVLSDVPDGCVAVGAPARIVRRPAATGGSDSTQRP